ncbi:MAG: hypothetical protein GY793_00495 [Proteobacteria bacterium]|nr:hypothetical protein [Pseudomonadota bacterium]
MKLKRLLFVAFAMMIFVIGCNDEDGSHTANAVDPPVVENETREQIAKRLNLPAEPDEELNHSTILGIDVDGDDIRDDLNRMVGFTLPNDQQARHIFERQAYLWTQMVKNQDNPEKLREIDDELEKLIDCKVRGYIQVPEELSDFGTDIHAVVQERLDLLNKIRRTTGRVYYERIPDDVIAAYCETFK